MRSSVPIALLMRRLLSARPASGRAGGGGGRAEKKISRERPPRACLSRCGDRESRYVEMIRRQEEGEIPAASRFHSCTRESEEQ